MDSGGRVLKVVIAIDSFKGSIDSLTAGKAAAEGIRRVFPSANCVVRPLADGGEGTVDALVSGLGGDFHRVRVKDPLGRPVMARYGLVGETAVMEMAQAAGITLVKSCELDPMNASTYGVGEMILDAVRHGAKKFVMGIGGSATNDGGRGMLEALGLYGPNAEPKIRPGDFEFRVACDVKNPLCGPDGASAVFGPQKGATPAQVAELDARLRAFADASGDPGETPGDGAAGGLGYALRVYLKAKLEPGVEMVLSEMKLADEIREADVVVTGEGKLDGQSVMGKAPIGVATLAKKFGKPVLAFCGVVGEGSRLANEAGIDAYFPILQRVTPLFVALERRTATANLTATAEQAFRCLRISLAAR